MSVRQKFGWAVPVAAVVIVSGTPMGALGTSNDAMPARFVYLRDVDPSIQQDMRYAGSDNFTGRPVPGYEAPECIW